MKKRDVFLLLSLVLFSVSFTFLLRADPDSHFITGYVHNATDGKSPNGMKVIAYNRSPRKIRGVKMVSLNQLLKESDAISLHTTHEETNNNMIGKAELAKMKEGVIIVNTVDRELVDEKAMADALKSKKVDTYVYEGEDLVHTPLAKLENAIGFKGFAWFTKEALDNLYKIWVSNLVALAKGKPQNRVV